VIVGATELLVMDDSRIWIFAAMIFIAFVNWLNKQIQSVREARKAQGRDRDQSKRFRESRESPRVGGTEGVRESSSRSEAVSTPPNSLKEILRHIAEEQSIAQRALEEEPTPRQEKPAPPPLPVEKETARPEPVAMPEPALVGREKKTEKTDAPGGLPREKQKPERPVFRHRTAIRRALTDKGNLRNILVLKEILDTPKGLC